VTFSTPRFLRSLAVLAATVLTATLLPAPGSSASGVPLARRQADDFVIASFNVLGADHTDGRHGRRGFDTSDIRLVRALKVLRRTHVEVVGLQEFQRPQYDRFLARVGDRWAVYAGASWDTDNSIAWRTDRFSFVEGWSVPVPYFGGNLRQMPVVGLRSVTTGRTIYVMNTHNPADTRGDAAQWRAEAVRIQRTVTRKISNERHAPVFMTGDMNDRAEFFCPFTRNGVMHSFLGGSHPKGGECRPPASGVDWIFGNRYVDFGTPRIDRSPLVAATTDHPVVSSHVRLRRR
jgi:endonuclease/exonuclease/phosphatase family metal-dependent hydrolase